jgi:hypothetical protein
LARIAGNPREIQSLADGEQQNFPLICSTLSASGAIWLSCPGVFTPGYYLGRLQRLETGFQISFPGDISIIPLPVKISTFRIES